MQMFGALDSKQVLELKEGVLIEEIKEEHLIGVSKK
jgi:hypothetical protein